MSGQIYNSHRTLFPFPPKQQWHILYLCCLHVACSSVLDLEAVRCFSWVRRFLVPTNKCFHAYLSCIKSMTYNMAFVAAVIESQLTFCGLNSNLQWQKNCCIHVLLSFWLSFRHCFFVRHCWSPAGIPNTWFCKFKHDSCIISHTNIILPCVCVQKKKEKYCIFTFILLCARYILHIFYISESHKSCPSLAPANASFFIFILFLYFLFSFPVYTHPHSALLTSPALQSFALGPALHSLHRNAGL